MVVIPEAKAIGVANESPNVVPPQVCAPAP